MFKRYRSRKGSDIIDIHHFINEGNILFGIVLHINRSLGKALLSSACKKDIC